MVVAYKEGDGGREGGDKEAARGGVSDYGGDHREEADAAIDYVIYLSSIDAFYVELIY